MRAVAGRAAPTAPAINSSISFEELFQLHYPGMVRLAHLLTGSNLAAEDLVQDSFVRLQRAWDRVDDPPPYLRTSVVNACRSWHRQRSRESSRLQAVALPEPNLSASTIEMLDVLRRLPWGQRTALVLRFYEDLSEADIARAMGCRPGTVKSHLHRGLGAVRKVIEQ